MATTSHQWEHHTSSNAAEPTRFEHHQCKKSFTVNVNYQFAEYLKRRQILKPENYTKWEALNMLIHAHS